MKIEIELEEIESLRKQIADLTRSKEFTEKRLYEARIEEMENKAIKLSRKLFNKYMQATFKALGFDDNSFGDVVDFDLGYNQDKKWFEQDITVTLSASVSEHFRRAYMTIGLLNKGWSKEDFLLENPEYTTP